MVEAAGVSWLAGENRLELTITELEHVRLDVDDGHARMRARRSASTGPASGRTAALAQNFGVANATTNGSLAAMACATDVS